MTPPSSLRNLQGLHLQNIAQLSSMQVVDMVHYAALLKAHRQRTEMRRVSGGKYRKHYIKKWMGITRARDSYLMGKCIALFFEQPSTRTRLAIHAAAAEGGGSIVDINNTTHLGSKESLADTICTVSQFCDAIAYRGVSHQTYEMICTHATIPVINALTTRYHPTQVLADLLTIYEHFGVLRDVKVAYVGDCANNIARSLALAAVQSGIKLTCAGPSEYQLDTRTISLCEAIAADHTRLPQCTDDMEYAVSDADVVYTDVWCSMGDEAEKKERLSALARYRVTAECMHAASSRAIFMHCLPANRGHEVTDEVLDGERSVVWQQAGNRQYIFGALFRTML